MVAYFRQRVDTPELAFDLAAETFAAVIESAERYSAEGSAAAWLFGIARNKLLESWRRGRVEQQARLKLRLEPVELSDEQLELVKQRADRGSAQLAAALDALPAATRDALLARVVEEESYEQIAGTLGCSEHVVRQRVHRGLTALRAELMEER